MQFEQQYQEKNTVEQKDGKKLQGIATMIFVFAYFLDFLIIIGKNYENLNTGRALVMTATVMSVFASIVSFANFGGSQRPIAYISTFFYFVGGLLFVCGQDFFLFIFVEIFNIEYIYLSIIGATAALLLADDGNQNQQGRMKQESYGIVIMIFLTLFYVNNLSRWSQFRQYDDILDLNAENLIIASYVIAIVGCLISITAGLIKNQIVRFIATFFIFVAAVLNLAALICYIVKLDQFIDDAVSKSEANSPLLFLLFANQFTFYIGKSATQLMSD